MTERRPESASDVQRSADRVAALRASRAASRSKPAQAAKILTVGISTSLVLGIVSYLGDSARAQAQAKAQVQAQDDAQAEADAAAAAAAADAAARAAAMSTTTTTATTNTTMRAPGTTVLLPSGLPAPTLPVVAVTLPPVSVAKAPVVTTAKKKKRAASTTRTSSP